MIESIGIFLAIISYVPLSLDAHVLTKRADIPLTSDFGWTEGAGEDDLRDLSFGEYLKESEYKNHEKPYYEFDPNKSQIVKNDDDDEIHRWEEKLEQVGRGEESEKKSGEHIKREKGEDVRRKNGKSEMRLIDTAETRPRRSLGKFQRLGKLGSQSESEFGSEDGGEPRSKRSEYEFSVHSPKSRPRGTHAAEFSYENTKEWSINNPECSGRRQSPVNIDTERLIGLEVPSDLIWAGYWERPENLTISNTGHTVELRGNWDDVTPFITEGPLIGDYLFDQLHFHWGMEDSVGSEHTIDNESFPMEMHMVHYKRQYGSFENALNYRDGLAVVAFFFEICDTPNVGLDLLMDGLIRIRNRPSVRESIQPCSLDVLHSIFERDYVTYMGSLTTPPCREIVTWLVSMNALPISKTQIDSFRKISNRWPGKGNYRPQQALNGRLLYYVEN